MERAETVAATRVVRRKGIHIPAANEAAINPNPRPERIPKESHPSLKRVTAQEDGPVLVLPGPLLGLGHGSRYFGGRKRPGGKRGTSGTPWVPAVR